MYVDGIGSIAQDNPNVDFILVDSNPTDSEGNEVEVANVYAMTFAEQESRFLRYELYHRRKV